MNKLMIAAAIVCAAALSQAATVSWGVSTVRPAKNADGDYATSGNIGTAGTLSIFLVDADTYGKLTFDDAFYTTYSAKTADYSDATSNMGSLTLTSDNTYKKDDHVYAAILLTYKDANDKLWYVANKADVIIQEFDGTAQDASILKLHSQQGGEGGIFSGDTITGWSAAPTSAPEPTSAMLLLIGMAGLALRRGRRS